MKSFIHLIYWISLIVIIEHVDNSVFQWVCYFYFWCTISIIFPHQRTAYASYKMERYQVLLTHHIKGFIDCCCRLLSMPATVNIAQLLLGLLVRFQYYFWFDYVFPKWHLTGINVAVRTLFVVHLSVFSTLINMLINKLDLFWLRICTLLRQTNHNYVEFDNYMSITGASVGHFTFLTHVSNRLVSFIFICWYRQIMKLYCLTFIFIQKLRFLPSSSWVLWFL